MVDFELASGQRITDNRYGDATPWYRKAEIIAKMFRMAMKSHKDWDCTDIVKGIRTLVDFGIGNSHSGLKHRPRFLMGETTVINIVNNISKYTNDGATAGASRNKANSVRHVLEYRTRGLAPIIVDPRVRFYFADVKRLLYRPHRRLRGKQKVD